MDSQRSSIRARLSLENTMQLVKIEEIMSDDALLQPNGDTILHSAIRAGFMDLACQIVSKFPQLGIAENLDGETPLYLLAKLPSAFRSGYHPGILKFIIYDLMPPSLHEEKKKHIQSVFIVEKIVGFMKENMFEILESRSNRWNMADGNARSPIALSVKTGVVEILEKINDACFLFLIVETDEMGRNLIWSALENRQFQVLKFLILHTQPKIEFTKTMEGDRNMLHVAAELPEENPWSYYGPVERMHLENKWFESVKQILPSNFKFQRNIDGDEPSVVFRKTHEALLNERTEILRSNSTPYWIMTLSLFCLVQLFLAFVPGGVDENRLPKHADKLAFDCYCSFYWGALISGFASFLSFLPIIYYFDEHDSKSSLPLNVFFGHTFLYVSLTFAVLAFYSGLALEMQREIGYREVILSSLATSFTMFCMACLSRSYSDLVKCLFWRKNRLPPPFKDATIVR